MNRPKTSFVDCDQQEHSILARIYASPTKSWEVINKLGITDEHFLDERCRVMFGVLGKVWRHDPPYNDRPAIAQLLTALGEASKGWPVPIKAVDLGRLNDIEDERKPDAPTLEQELEVLKDRRDQCDPLSWFAKNFPKLTAQHGDALDQQTDEDGNITVFDLNEDFLAATIGRDGSPDSPTVYLTEEARFYSYDISAGIFVETREENLITRWSMLLNKAASVCKNVARVGKLKFSQRDTQTLKGVVTKAKSLLGVDRDFFESANTDFIPCANGMLRLSDRSLQPFGPEHRRRNKLAVSFQANATCPKFLDNLLIPALPEEDIDLIQRWSGLAILGENLAQKMVILSGTAGGGKGTLIRVIQGVIGSRNVASLRPNQLAERFELGRLMGKTLLYGADVPEDFLNCKGASVLKSLTGGDPVTLEFKGSNERPEIVCRFNAIVTCNSRLRVMLEGDEDAWRRRLVILAYERPPAAVKIHDLSEVILRDEGSGVLNWMLEGYSKLKEDGFQLAMTAIQAQRVDDLLLESQSELMFVRECIQRDPLENVTTDEVWAKYVEFCDARGWVPSRKDSFSRKFSDRVTTTFRITQRHDIFRGENQRRGWMGIGLTA